MGMWLLTGVSEYCMGTFSRKFSTKTERIKGMDKKRVGGFLAKVIGVYARKNFIYLRNSYSGVSLELRKSKSRVTLE